MQDVAMGYKTLWWICGYAAPQFSEGASLDHPGRTKWRMHMLQMSRHCDGFHLVLVQGIMRSRLSRRRNCQAYEKFECC